MSTFLAERGFSGKPKPLHAERAWHQAAEHCLDFLGGSDPGEISLDLRMN